MTRARIPFSLLALLALVLSTVPAFSQGAGAPPDDAFVQLPPVEVGGIEASVRVRRDEQDVPHIFARHETDAMFVLGYVHAQDRFFQMDILRRTFSGTLAEILGAGALEQDIQFRTLGLRRGAVESEPALEDQTRAWLEAYAAGVNAWIAQTPALPPEYDALRLTKASVAEWTPIDSLAIAKGLAFGLSFGLDDLDLTEALLTFQAAGQFFGFDGNALFSEDLYRSAPFDPAISIPGFLEDLANAPSTTPNAPKAGPERLAELTRLAKKLPSYLADGRALELIQDVRQGVEQAPALENLLERRDAPLGSNWWVTSGNATESGRPVLANDPHLGLDTPSIFYEVGVRAAMSGPDDPDELPMNVFGVSFPGAPGVILGCNVWICWGATTNPMDVTDLYLEEVRVDPALGPVATIFEGQPEPLVPVPQSYRVNALDPEALDAVVDSGIGVTDPGGLTLIVPRRNNGPIVSLMPNPDDPSRATAISVQYTGWRATREMDAFRSWARARSIDDFRAGVQFFDVGSQNWSVASRDEIAYFTSAEMPVREDLQTLSAPDGGVPPFLLRDGTHGLRHEWLPVQNPQPQQSLPYEILPYSEMPQVRNPASGYVLNCNNDPVGTTLDNNPLNQLRPGGGLYYLNPGYASGFRMGRLQRLYDRAMAGSNQLSRAQIQEFQANNQLLDAEIFVPFLFDAFVNANDDDAPAMLADLAADPALIEAASRLAAWDFSTPTGIVEGFDPGDGSGELPAPDQAEINASVAATIYAAWRGLAVQRIVDLPLRNIDAALALADPPPIPPVSSLRAGSGQALALLRHLLENFDQNQGVGASGLQFFQIVEGLGAPQPLDDPADVRDVVLLETLRDALALLASDEFAPAFANSTHQEDYRWGRLHRIVFDHPLGGPFDLPGLGGLEDLAEDLPGVARAGGFGALDASSHSARADGLNEFMFGSGPARRFVGRMMPGGPDAAQIVPGGTSGVLGSPFQADQLRLWLVNELHPLRGTPRQAIDNTRTFQAFLPAGN